MLYLLNSIPNSILLDGLKPGETREISVIALDTAGFLLSMGGCDFISAVGHESTARIFSDVLGLDIKANRINIEPKYGDLFICGLIRTPRRLGEGEMYSPEEIATMPITWVMFNT